jgi:hypothetical protein
MPLEPLDFAGGGASLAPGASRTAAAAADPSNIPTTGIRRALLAAAIAIALLFRAYGLGTYGISEDEAAKLRAIEAYGRGEFSANAEHPMLMKLAILASLEAAERWNALAVAPPVTPEAALRLPNVLAGSATVAAIYGVGRLFFGSAIALAAAFLVALDPNVTALNRIGKEDTLAMFFLLLAIWCYERAKVIGASHPDSAQTWYRLAAAAFGLMLGSKYVPWFFGFYAIFNYAAVRHAGANAPRPGPYYASLAAAFLAVNFAVLLPETWAYCLAYLRGDHLTHHGYAYAGAVYANSAPVDPAGVPITYYLHLIAAKVPLPVLGCAAAGIVPLVTRRRERGYIWLRVFLVLPLLCYSLFASKFQRYALSTLLVLDVLAAVGLVAGVAWIQRRAWSAAVRHGVSAAAVAAVLGLLLAAQLRAAPFYSIYQNSAGAAAAPPVTTFPEEAYDYGIREAVAGICAAAAPGAAVVSDAPMAVAYYVARSGRADLEVSSLSGRGLAHAGEQWVIVQDGHRYFENAAIMDQLRRTARPWREYRLAGTPVLQVFRLPAR